MKLNDYEIEHDRIVRELAPECTLLLRTDGSFPLEAPCRVALYGNGARNTLRGGTGSGEVYSRRTVSVEEGLEESGFTITTKDWLDAYQKVRAARKEAWVRKQKKAHGGISGIMFLMGAFMPEPDYDLPLEGDGDAAVYVLSRISGEGTDRTVQRGDIRLTESEVRDILRLNERFSRFLLVLNTGGVVDLSEVKEVRNILLLSQPGALAGEILADLLLGKSCPSGKLSATWAAPDEYCPLGELTAQDDTHYKEGIYVGYRYFDAAGKAPLFPFGFGRSYTTFAIEAENVRREGTQIFVDARVTNTGRFKGKEVVQLYVSLPQGELDQPYQVLAAFEKTPLLAPEEACRVTLAFRMEEFASYDAGREAYILEAGDCVLRLGNSSRETRVIGAVSLDRTVVTRRAKNVLGRCGFDDWKPEIKGQEISPELPRISLSAADFRTVETVYDRSYEIEDLVKSLSDKELCYINIGSFDRGFLSIIGNASRKVAGAAGDFTAMLETKGLPCAVTADGPAGLRISKEYTRDRKGIHPVGNDMLGMISAALPKPVGKLLALTERKPKKGETIYEQYCTMIPIATAVAQSFNTELAARFGDIVGSEMERFRVDYWLAPAMNIHRSIFCGRNFEYYSEDPLLAGRIAAAVTKGVQAHPGCAATIKHYAANNQETNRYNNNSLVSERAMREIYLKGFGICVREAQPKAVMTSYNLLNGTHTSEHRGLIEDILRCEFGFSGIVMTDWIVAMMSKGGKYPAPVSWKIAAAGGDVMMPGSKKDYKILLAGRKAGKVSRQQLEINASRMVRSIRGMIE